MWLRMIVLDIVSKGNICVKEYLLMLLTQG